MYANTHTDHAMRERMKAGLRRGNLADIGYGATLSARVHQRILYKPQLETVIGLAREVEALGVNVAHSGTVIGVLLDPAHANDLATAAYLLAHLPGLESISLHRIVGGGPRFSEKPHSRSHTIWPPTMVISTRMSLISSSDTAK